MIRTRARAYRRKDDGKGEYMLGFGIMSTTHQ